MYMGGVGVQEASVLAQERLSRELDDAVREHREQLEAIKERRRAGLRGILLRIAHSQLSRAFDSFVDAAWARKERTARCRKIVGRMLHGTCGVTSRVLPATRRVV
jgi:hypothetical protein